MKIRLKIDVAVNTKEHAQFIYDWLKDNISWFGSTGGEEDYYISFHKCFHDEDPVKPCETLEEWRNGVVTWHNGIEQ